MSVVNLNSDITGAHLGGLSTDTKPTVNIPGGYVFLEFDTGNRFVFYGGTWYPLTDKSTVVGSLPNGTNNIGVVGYISNDASDASSPQTMQLVRGSNMLFNGLTWDRQRGNTSLTLLASAPRTTNTSSPIQTSYNTRGIILFLNVTAASGTGGIHPRLIGQDGITSNYYQLAADANAVIAVGQYCYVFYPGVSNTGVTQAVSVPIPRNFFVLMMAGDSTSYTYSLTCSFIL